MELSFDILAKYDQLDEAIKRLEKFEREMDSAYKMAKTQYVPSQYFESIQNDIDKASDSVKRFSADFRAQAGASNEEYTKFCSQLQNGIGEFSAASEATQRYSQSMKEVYMAIARVTQNADRISELTERMKGLNPATDSSTIEKLGVSIANLEEKIQQDTETINTWNGSLNEAGEAANANANAQSILSESISEQQVIVDGLKERLIDLSQAWMKASGNKKLEIGAVKSDLEKQLSTQIAKLDMMKIKSNELSMAFSEAEEKMSYAANNMSTALERVNEVSGRTEIREKFQGVYAAISVAEEGLKKYQSELASIANNAAHIERLQTALEGMDTTMQSGAAAKIEGEMRRYSDALDTSIANIAKLNAETQNMERASEMAKGAISELTAMIAESRETIDSYKSKLSELNQQYAVATDENKASIEREKESVVSAINEEEARLSTMQATLNSIQGSWQQLSSNSTKSSSDIVEASKKAADAQNQMKARTRENAEEQKRLTEEAQKQKSTVAGLEGTWKQMLTTIGIATGVKSFISQLVSVNAKMEQTKVSLYGLMQSEHDADMLFNSIKNVSSHSAIGLGSLTGVAQQFLAFGESAERIPKLLEAINEVSRGSEQRFSQLASALEMMAAMGQVNTRTIRTMIKAGFNPLFAISKQTGKSVNELMKEVKKGTIPVSEITNSFIAATKEGGMFYGMNERMSQTMSYQFAQMKKNVAGFFLELGKGSDSTLHGATRMLLNLTKHLKELATALKYVALYVGISKSVQLLALAFNGLSLAVKMCTGAIATMSAVEKTSGIGNILFLVSAAAMAIYDLTQKTKDSTDAITKYNEAVQGASSEVDSLFLVIQNTSKDSKVHKENLEKLVGVYDEYGITIDKGRGLLEDEGKVLDQINEKRATLIGLLQQEASERAKAEFAKKTQEEKDTLNKNFSDTWIKDLEGTNSNKVGKITKGKAVAIGTIAAEVISNEQEAINKAATEGVKYGNDKLKDELQKILGENAKDVKVLYRQGASRATISLGKFGINGDYKLFGVTPKVIAQLKALQEVSKRTGVSIKDMSYDMLTEFFKLTNGTSQLDKTTQEFSDTINKEGIQLSQGAYQARLMKMSVESLHETIKNLIAANGNNIITFKLNIDDAAVPKWMKDKGFSTEQLRQNAAWYASLVQHMQQTGKKSIVVGKGKNAKTITYEQAATSAAQYANATTDSQAEDEKKAAAEEEIKKKADKAAKAAEKAAEKARRKAEKIKEAKRVYDDTLKEAKDSMSANLNEQKISLMEDGVEKQLREAENSYNSAIKAAEGKIKKVAESLYKYRKAQGYTSQTIEQIKNQIMKAREADAEFGGLIKAYNSAVHMAGEQLTKAQQDIVDSLANTYDQSNKERADKIRKLKADISYLETLLADAQKRGNAQLESQTSLLLKNANAQSEWLKGNKEAWMEYYTQYGTFIQKKAALDEKFYHDTQGMSPQSPEFKLKYEEYKKSQGQLKSEELSQNIDWHSVFSDIGMLSAKAARMQLAQLNEYTKTDEFRSLDVSNQKTITDAISNLEQQAGPQIRGAFKKFGKAVDAYKESIEALNAAKMNEMLAHEQLTSSINNEANAVKALDDAQKQLAAAQKKGNAEEIAAAKENVQQANIQLNVAKQQVHTARANADAVSENTKSQSRATKEAQRQVSSSGKNLTQSFDLVSNTLNGLKSGSLSQAFNSVVSLVNGFHDIRESSKKAAEERRKDSDKESKASDNAVQKSEKMTDAIGAAGQAIQAVPNVWVKAIGAILSVLDILGDDLKGGIGNFVGTLLEKVGTIVSTLVTQIANGQFFTDIGKGVFNLLSGWWNGLGNAFGFKDNWNSYRKAEEKYQKLSSVWENLISKKKEYIGLSYGAEAIKLTKETEELIKTEQKQTKLLAKQYASAWKKGSHSAGYKFDKKMSKGAVEGWTWGDVSQAAGTAVYGMSDLFELSSKQLLALKEANTEWWVQLDEKTREYLDKIIEFQDAEKDLADSLKERLTGVSFDEFRNNFHDAIQDMSSSATEMCESFEEKLRNAIMDSMMDREFKDRIQKLYDDFSTANEDGDITKAEYDALMDENARLAEEMQVRKQQLKLQYAWSSQESSSGSSRGFESMTQDQASELNGRFTAMNEYAASIKGLVQQREGRETESWSLLGMTLANIRANILSSLDMQSNSYLELVAIRENTASAAKYLSTMRDDIVAIRKKVSHI